MLFRSIYLWEPDAYKDKINSITLYYGIVIGISGLLALFLTILFVVKGSVMFPAAAALSWAVLVYIGIDFGFWGKVFDMSADGPRLQQRTGKTMIIVGSVAELLQHYDLMEEPGNPNLMLQEYIPGGEDSVWMFNGYFDRDSRCLAGFTGKKIRQTPAYTGSTSLGIMLHNQTVAETTERFMKAIGYRGILDIGYRYDARDAQYKVLDVNPRIGSTFRLFVDRNGLDVARVLYRDLTGQRIPEVRPAEGRKWIVEDQDLWSSRRYWNDGKLSVSQWLASFRGVREGAWFAWDDPQPFLRLSRSMGATSVRWLKRKLALRGRQRTAS